MAADPPGYPKALEARIVLRDGSAVMIRPIRPEDAPKLQAAFRRLSPEDVRLRFLHPMKDLPDALAKCLTEIDYGRDMAFLALDPVDDSPVAVARLAADGRCAEFGIIVRGDWQGRGLGYALMERLIAYARGRGLRKLHGLVLVENHAMLQMCREFGFTVQPDPEDPGVYSVRLALAAAPGSAGASRA